MESKYTESFKTLLLLIVIFLGFLVFSISPSIAATTLKKGSGGNYRDYSQRFVDQKVSWTYSWSANPDAFASAQSLGLEYVPHFHEYYLQNNYTRAQLEEIVKLIIGEPSNPARLGKYWLVGNEPDLQSNYTLQQEVNYYALVIDVIKAKDPTAKIIFGGLSTPKTWYAQTLQEAWPTTIRKRSLKEDIAGWHIHYYSVNVNSGLYENPPRDTAFEDTIKNWKDWQNSIYPNTETWLTEYGISSQVQGAYNYCDPGSGEQLCLNFMKASTNFLLAQENSSYRIDRFAWFYIGQHTSWWPALLYDANGNITVFGQYYKTVIPYYPGSTTPTPTPTITLSDGKLWESYLTTGNTYSLSYDLWPVGAPDSVINQFDYVQWLILGGHF
jgi:hypothetical protein